MIKIWPNRSKPGKKQPPALKQIHTKVLKKFDYSKKKHQLIAEMLHYACEHGKPRPASGLVEQQQLFMKYAKKWNVYNEPVM
jgi:hypothetical protein